MAFNQTIVAAPMAGLMLAAFAAGCADSFSRRVANSADVCTAKLQDDSRTNLADFWMQGQTLHLLQTSPRLIETDGMIAFAFTATINHKEGRKVFHVTYLSKKADVKEIVIVENGKIVCSFPPPTRKFAKHAEKYFVRFVEEVDLGSPGPLDGYDARGLSVMLIRDNGKSIGPAPLLSDMDIWEDVKKRTLAEKKWQDKAPWLYERLLEDPGMEPMWYNPEDPDIKKRIKYQERET